MFHLIFRLKKKKIQIILIITTLSHTMWSNCTKYDITIIGDANIVRLNRPPYHSNVTCASYHYGSSANAVLMVLMSIILISCICCCLFRRRNCQVQRTIDNNQHIVWRCIKDCQFHGNNLFVINHVFCTTMNSKTTISTCSVRKKWIKTNTAFVLHHSIILFQRRSLSKQAACFSKRWTTEPRKIGRRYM